MSEPTKKSVAVIGLGPSGLAMVKELKAAGCFGEIVGFDRCSKVGGRWSLTENAGVWKELCMNVSRKHLEFSDFPWEKGKFDGHEKAYANIYAHCTETRAYMEGYAKHFDLYPHLKLGTTVRSIERTDKGWRIVTARSDTGTTQTQTHDFDALVMCSGAQAKAHHPLESKFPDFDGEVLHSKDFRSGADYKGKRVLVIGGNVSGSEIAALLAEGSTTGDGCQKAVNSIRRMPYHAQKFAADGSNTCFDDNMFVRLPVWLDRIVPDAIIAKGLQTLFQKLWPEQCDVVTPNCAVAASPDIRDCGATITKNYVDSVKEGILSVKPGVAKVEGHTVHFVDGSTEDFDTIICATGYDFDVSFLPDSVLAEATATDPESKKKILRLYKDTLVPSADLVDNLAFCGIINSIGPYFAQGEMQARYIAAVWSGSIPYPTPSAREANAEAMVKKRMDTSNLLNRYIVATAVNECLGDELGITPSFATAFWNPKKYLLGPVYACFYRTDPKAPGGDETVAKQCQERFDSLLASSPQVREESKEQ